MPSDINAIGVVTSAYGEVYAAVNGELRPLENGSPIYQHDKLVTGSGASLEVRFQDDTLLSQGQDSTISISDYVYDSSDSSEFLVGMAQGTFRMVTGKIAEQNPERFKVGTPLATIGIRGTTTVHEINANGETHGIEQIHSGKALVIQGMDGSVRMISASRELVDISSAGVMSPVRSMSMQEFISFRDIAPSAIRQEQEINEERGQDSQPDENDPQSDPDSGAESPEDGTAVTDESPGGDIDPLENEQEESAGQDSLLVNNFADDAGVLGPETSFNDPNENLPIQSEVAQVSEFPVNDNSLDFFWQDTNPDPVETNPDPVETNPDPVETNPDPAETNPDPVEIRPDPAETNPDPVEIRPDMLFPESKVNKGSVSGEMESYTTSSDPTAQSVIRGTKWDDTLTGSGVDQTLYGLGGNDTINAEGGDDTLNGGYGNNVLNGGDGIDFADFSFLDAETSVTVKLAEFVAERSGEEDELRSIEGLITGAAADTLHGDDGANTFVYGGGRDVVKGYDGADVLDLSAFNAESGFLIGSLDSFASIMGTDDHCLMESIEIVIGSKQGDTFIGDGGEDTFYGSGGDDELNGGGGNDKLFGDQGLDTLSGGAGSNYLDGGDGVDFADFSFLDAATPVTVKLKTFTADHGSDQDELRNIEGVITGEADDVLTGDDNANTFIYGGGNDVIDGGDGVDTLDLSKFTTSSGFHVELTDDFVRVNGTSVEADIENVECIIGSSNDDTVSGSAENETFFGGAGEDFLEGNGGSDILYGDAGDDDLNGGGGNDTLFGGSGSDFLMGSLGTDTLTGGAGADTFYFGIPSSIEGGDTIVDFVSGEDKIKYDAAAFIPVNDLYKTEVYDGVVGDASGAQFVYDTTEHKLYYDADGSGTDESGELIATFTNGADISDSDIEPL